MAGLTDRIPVLNLVDSSQGTLANLLMLQENDENINNFLKNISEYIIQLIGSAAIEEIKEDVINNMQRMKHIIHYNHTRNIGLPESQNGYVYCRVDERTIEIYKDGVPQWDTRYVMCQVQTSGYHVIYPVINKEQTSQCEDYENYNCIRIEFSDPIQESGYVIFI